MSFDPVSSYSGCAIAIRDHVLPLVRARGTLELQRGPLRLLVLRHGPWEFHHWTPFNSLSPEEASSPGYRHALERQHTRADLPYGLDLWWEGEKVLGVLWSDSGEVEVLCFFHGAWEDEALTL